MHALETSPPFCFKDGFISNCYCSLSLIKSMVSHKTVLANALAVYTYEWKESIFNQ